MDKMEMSPEKSKTVTKESYEAFRKAIKQNNNQKISLSAFAEGPFKNDWEKLFSAITF